MATTSNIKDAGWFCHAPNKSKPAVDFALPPTSQIPGLTEFPDNYPPADEPRRTVFRETDSKYVTLSKMGGRADLLRIASPKPQPKEAKGYPTVDWFYLDDIRREEEEKKQQEIYKGHHQPMLPEYMVHHEYAPHGNKCDSQNKSRNPLTKDPTTVFQREGDNATNKTIRIQEARPSGYGIRGEKQKNKVAHMPAMPKYQRAKGRESELDAGKAKVRTMQATKEEERPLMSKILSFGYQKDWEHDHDEWQKEQEELMKMQHESIMHPTKQDKPQSEYQYQTTVKGRPGSKDRVPSHGRRAPSGSSTASHRRQKSQVDKEQPAIFDLPKYDSCNSKDIEPMRYNPTMNLSSLRN